MKTQALNEDVIAGSLFRPIFKNATRMYSSVLHCSDPGDENSDENTEEEDTDLVGSRPDDR